MASMTESEIWNMIIATLIGTIAVVVGIYFLQQWLLKDKRKAFIGKWMSGVFTVIEVRKVNAFTKHIPIKHGKTELLIPFDVSKPTFRSKKAWIYCVDVDTSQIGFVQTDFNVPGELTDMVFAKGTIKHIVSGINKPQIAGFILYILLGIAIGIPSGILIGQKFF